MRRYLAFAPIFQAAFAHPALAQTIGQGSGVDVSIWRVLLSLLFCLALGACAIFLLRGRFGSGRTRLLGSNGSRRIKLAEQQFLGPQRYICLIEIDGRPYAALFAPQAATLVPLLAPGQPVASPEDTPQP